MSEESSHSAGKGTGWRWLLLPLVLILLFTGLRWTLQSDLILDKLREQAVQAANEHIEGSLSVATLRGDLLYGVTLSGVELHDSDGERVLVADSISVRYTLLELIRGLEIRQVRLDGVELEARELDSGEWNMMRLLSRQEPEEETQPVEPPSFEIRDLRMDGFRARITSGALPDGSLAVRDLSLRASAGVRDGEWFASLGDLRFNLDERRIPGGVDIGMAGQYSGEEVTLERMLVGTGRSLLRMEARAELEDPLSGEGVLGLGPLSSEDLKSWADLPLAQDLNGEVRIAGGREHLRVSVDLSAEGLNYLRLSAEIDLSDDFRLKTFDLEASGFDGPGFTGLESVPTVGSMQLRLQGDVSFRELQSGRLEGDVTVENLQTGDAELESIRAELQWRESVAELQGEWIQQDQRVEVAARTGELFADLPVWEAQVQSSGLNLQQLLAGDVPRSDLNVRMNLNGRGFELSDEPVAFELRLTDSRIHRQPIDRLTADGHLTEREAVARLALQTGGSGLTLDLEVDDWLEEPEYRFVAALTRFDLNDLVTVDGFPTDLNAELSGSGRGIDPDRMEIQAVLAFDSSFVNREQIEMLRAELEIDGPVLTVSEARLVSPIADLETSFRQHLRELRDPANTADFRLELKDLQPLAPLFGVELLQAGGRVAGTLDRGEQGTLHFSAEMDLEEPVYDLYRAESVSGTVEADLLEETLMDLALRVNRPEYTDLEFEALDIELSAAADEAGYRGDIQAGLRMDEQGGLDYRGTFGFEEEELRLQTTLLDITSTGRTLRLQEPFETVLREGVLTMEPLRIAAAGEAHLSLSIPHLDADRQMVELESEQIDLGTFQQLILGERYIEAMMSGYLSLHVAPEQIEADIGLLFEQIGWQQGEVDSLGLSLSVENERLDLRAEVRHRHETMLEMEANLPYVPGDPMAFDDAFFRQPVEGRVRIPETSLSFWTALVPGVGEVDVEGTLSFDSALSGLAGEPAFNGRLEVTEAMISAVPVGLAELSFDYEHENARIDLDGSLQSRGVTVAGVQADLPLYLDLRRPGVDMPGDTDSVAVEVTTDQFDLAILNEFLDRDQLRDLAGRINGSFRLDGPLGTLESRGNMELRGGSIRVVPANVQVTDIRSDIRLEPDRLELESLSMRSGPGRLTGTGSVSLEAFRPGSVQLDLDAVQFRIANTQERNAIIDLNSRLSGTVEEPVLTGSVRFRSGFFMLQNFGEDAVEEVRLEEEPEREPFPFYENLSMEMNVAFDRQFFIRNRQYLDMEVELAGELDLVKEPRQDMQLFGSIEGVQGFARPLGRTFQIEDAIVSFFGPVTNPELQIRTFYNPPRSAEEVTIWYVIEGEVEDPVFRFESDPYLELQDIFSYTLFGQPFYALDSWQQALTGGGSESTASDVAMELLLDRFGTLAAQQLGIDVVQIDTNRSSTGSSTTIKTGWYLSERTFFAVLNEIGGSSPKTLFMLEYMLRRNLELIVTQGDDSREGVDLRWRYDY